MNLLLRGDARSIPLADESVHCVVTSPPYYSLRDYGTGRWEGGDSGCDHVEKQSARRDSPGGYHNSRNDRTGAEQPSTQATVLPYRDTCGKCGARRVDRQLGLEPSPEAYVAAMLAVFREVWRVLRDDGTLWLNIGDSYSGGGGASPDAPSTALTRSGQRALQGATTMYKGRQPALGLKPKDLIGIPWRLALALQADGWYLRSEIIWAKPNPMPESVTDRPTKSHEQVFLLSKSQTYYYDAEAVREPQSENPVSQARRLYSDVKAIGALGLKGTEFGQANGRVDWNERNGSGRNLRSVWSIATEAYPGAHFACVDAETECLTTLGWKTHDQLEPGMIAAQFDMNSLCLSWAPIEDIARYAVIDEPMVHAKSRDVEMVLTPNHRTIIARRHPRSREWGRYRVIRADCLKPSHAVPVSAPWEGQFASPVSPDWAELIGWYIAEGCETAYGWTVEIYQSRSANPEKVERIRSLLIAIGAEFTEAHATRQWRGEDRALVAFQVRGFAAAYLRQWCPRKGFHPSVLMWSDLLLARLLDGLIDGDGHRRDDGRFSFIQRSKESAGIAQAIGVRLGYSTMLSRRSEDTYSVYFTQKRLISFRGTGGEGAQIETEPYTGIVWCPKLPEGTWVARRNGRAFITGNTYPRKLIEPCIKAGTSQRGCCPRCGAPWVRETSVEQIRLTGSTGSAHVPGHNNWAGVTARTRKQVSTLGWQPSCKCTYWPDPIEQRGSEEVWPPRRPYDPVPCTVLDPFAGSGTTLVVAEALGRRAIGLDLSRDYLTLAQRRIERPHAVVPRPGRAEDLPLFRDEVACQAENSPEGD